MRPYGRSTGLLGAVPALLFALAACSAEERAGEGEMQGEEMTSPPVTQDMTEDMTRDSDEAFDLAGVSGADSEAVALDGELGCSFRAEDGDLLLIGMGWSGVEEPAQAVASPNGTPVKLISESADGFGGLLDGGTYTGGGLTVTVELKSGEDTDPSEGSAMSARLDAAFGDAARSWDGTWTCGP